MFKKNKKDQKVSWFDLTVTVRYIYIVFFCEKYIYIVNHTDTRSANSPFIFACLIFLSNKYYI
jgi:hypothetical protein